MSNWNKENEKNNSGHGQHLGRKKEQSNKGHLDQKMGNKNHAGNAGSDSRREPSEKKPGSDVKHGTKY